MKQNKSSFIGVPVTKKVYDALKEIADKSDVSIAAVVRTAIYEYFVAEEERCEVISAGARMKQSARKRVEQSAVNALRT